MPTRYRSIIADSARWEGFPFRDGDIIISTPSKSGTTWMQMICALLIFQTPDLHRPLTQISPWLDMQLAPREEILATLAAQQHRRFIKTHTPLDGLPHDRRATYIGVFRDPRDAGLSWANHLANLEFDSIFERLVAAASPEDLAELMPDGPPEFADTESGRFLDWVRHDAPPERTGGSGNLRAALHHLDTFWAVKDRPNVVIVHYADLQADLEGEMRRLAGRLGIDVPEERWPELVEAATFKRMRDRAAEVMPNSDDRIFRDAKNFFHRGRSGQWRDVLSEEDLHVYEARIAALADPERIAWLQRG